MRKQRNSGHQADHDDALNNAEEASSVFGSLADGAWKLATKGPSFAMDLARLGASEAERRALISLKRRMLAASEEYEDQERASESGRNADAPAEDAAWLDGGNKGPSPARIMEDLLDQALDQTREQAREKLMLRIIGHLVPDEARILSSLSDGGSTTLVHLAAGPRVGAATQRWLENLSSVGREAGIQLNDQVSYYVASLQSMGLVESGPEDKSLKLKYELIEADAPVRECIKQIEKLGMRPRFYRRTLRLSDAGMAFWKWCQPGAPTDAD